MQKEINQREVRMEMLNKLILQMPNDPFLHYGLALEYFNMFDFQKSIELFEEIIQKFPYYVPTYYQYAQAYEKLKDVEKAKEMYRKGIITASKENDIHALAELRSALNELEFED
jgi:tetratricopeptide (TPR) repeat protein